MVDCISLFSGAGGLDVGAEKAGANIFLCVENDHDSVQTLKLNNHNDNKIILEKDIAEVSFKKFRKGRDDLIVIGGPPCQPFSKNGYWVKNENRLIEKDPRNLLSQFLRTLEETNANAFLFENVESILHPTNKTEFYRFLASAESLGYKCVHYKANALDFGVPQRRKRIFVFGVKKKGAAIPLPMPTHVTVALPTNVAGVYLENIELFHSIKEEANLRGFINDNPELVDGSSAFSEEKIVYEFTSDGKRERRTFTSKRVAYSRNPKFSKNVLAVYGGACAICSKQMGIVQAAHIVPHSHESCVDSVQNGIALCVEHHALYDSALLMPSTGNKLFLNKKRVRFLIETGQAGGLDQVREWTKHDYTVPAEERHRPDEKLLDLALRIRLGTEN